MFLFTDGLVGVTAEIADNEIVLSGDIEQVAALWAENKGADLEKKKKFPVSTQGMKVRK